MASSASFGFIQLDNDIKKATKLIFDAELPDDHKVWEIGLLLEQVFESGYDQAAQDITLKLQSCIPDKTPTVADARVQGAWRDAANVALNHLGKLSRKE